MSLTTRVPAGGNDFTFDTRPIELPGFTLKARSVVIAAQPKLSEWVRAMTFAVAADDAAPYWIADLMAHAESRADWRDKLDQAIALTGLSLKRILNLAALRHVEEPERLIAPSPSHAEEVAPLSRPEQTEWLTKAKDEGWSRRELRLNIRATQRRKVIDGQAKLEGMYRVIYADPPWPYGDSGPPSGGSGIARAERHYPTMDIDDLCKLPVAAHATTDAVLFLWVTSPLLMQNPGPRDVIEAWGFTYKSSLVWDKVLGNFGSYVRVHHEFLLICTRGSCLPDQPTPQPDSVQVIRRSTEHSQKPEEIRQLITRLYTSGPYLELFGREKRAGWSVFGNDARLWASDAQAESE